MEHLITHGPNEEKIAKQAIRNRQPLPDFIVNAPILLPGLEIYLTAFLELNTERPGGMGINPIPVSRMRELGKWYEFSKDEIDDLVYLMKRLDKDHMERVRKQMQNKNGKPT